MPPVRVMTSRGLMDSTMPLTELCDVLPIIAAISHYDNEVTLDTQRRLRQYDDHM
jgi:hypothetical protein